LDVDEEFERLACAAVDAVEGALQAERDDEFTQDDTIGFPSDSESVDERSSKSIDDDTAESVDDLRVAAVLHKVATAADLSTTVVNLQHQSVHDVNSDTIGLLSDSEIVDKSGCDTTTESVEEVRDAAAAVPAAAAVLDMSANVVDLANLSDADSDTSTPRVCPSSSETSDEEVLLLQQSLLQQQRKRRRCGENANVAERVLQHGSKHPPCRFIDYAASASSGSCDSDGDVDSNDVDENGYDRGDGFIATDSSVGEDVDEQEI
jgi:hypothetical protein